MTRSLRILPSADADIDEAAEYIARDSLEQVLRLYDEVQATFQQLRAHPEQWPVCELNDPRLLDVRRCSISGFRNYIVFYRVVRDVVEVIRVLHGARDIPAIFRDQLSDGVD